jgi:hypothetical protein
MNRVQVELNRENIRYYITKVSIILTTCFHFTRSSSSIPFVICLLAHFVLQFLIYACLVISLNHGNVE